MENKERPLGQGSYGAVYSATYKGRPCVLKVRGHAHWHWHIMRKPQCHDLVRSPGRTLDLQNAVLVPLARVHRA